MITPRRILSALAALALCAGAKAADLSADDQKFMTAYEKVRLALAADNLDTAKQAAGELGEAGSALARSEKIAAARTEFAKLSERAIGLGRGRDGYYVVNCPMLQKEWFQPAGKISNPYAGHSMPECGMIRKK